jgi:hypothetical protein
MNVEVSVGGPLPVTTIECAVQDHWGGYKKAGGVQVLPCEVCRARTSHVVPDYVCTDCSRKSSHLKIKYIDPLATLVDCRTRRRAQKYRKVLAQLIGCFCPPYVIHTTEDNYIAEAIALSGRALTPQPFFVIGEFMRFDDFIMANLKYYDPHAIVTPLPFSEFNNRGNFPKATRLANEKADIVRHENYPSKRMLKKAGKMKAFLKHEKNLKLDFFALVADFKNRVIQAFSPLFSVVTGEAMVALQRHYHDCLSSCWLFAAGMNIDEFSDWLTAYSKGMLYFFMDDFTLYDTTFHWLMHVLVIKLYDRHGLYQNRWASAARWAQANGEGYSRHGWKYSVNGTMKSGAADTCLSNSLMNFLSHLYAIYRVSGRTVYQLMLSVIMAFMGDDNIILTQFPLPRGEVEIVLRNLGLKPKLIQVKTLDELIFLNMRPYPVAGVIACAPRIGRILMRLGTASEQQIDPMGYCYEVHRAFFKTLHHVPVARALITRVMQLTAHFKGRRTYVQMEDFYKMRHTDRIYDADDSTFQFVSGIYGVSVDDLLDLEAYIHSIPSVPYALKHDVLTKILEVDA